MVIVALPDFVLSATEVAVIVTWAGLGTSAGAVYVMGFAVVLLSVPQAAPMQPLPDRPQLTAVSDVFKTVAVNCCVPLIGTVAAEGETLTETGESALILPEQPEINGRATPNVSPIILVVARPMTTSQPRISLPGGHAGYPRWRRIQAGNCLRLEAASTSHFLRDHSHVK